MANRQYVIFGLNGEDFGIDITQVDQIIRMQEIYKVPNTPVFIEGLINLRGKVYTVFNLRKKFELPVRDFDDNTKIIIVNTASATVGFIVDEVSEIFSFDDADIENAPQAISNFNRRYLKCIAKKGEKIVLVLDLDQVLSLPGENEGLRLVKQA